MERVPQHPVEIEPGDKIQVRFGTGAALALVEAVLPPSELRVRVTTALLEGEVLLRWIDGTGNAWSVSAIAESADDVTALHLLGEWTQDQMRASQRISGNRHSLRGDIQAGSLAPGTRLDLVCLDISASGCRASGVGRMPADGDIVRLCCIHPFEEERWVLARVMRVSSLPFRRYEVGFRFDPKDNGERVWLAAWRDAWAYVSRDEPTAPAASTEAGEDETPQAA